MTPPRPTPANANDALRALADILAALRRSMDVTLQPINYGVKE